MSTPAPARGGPGPLHPRQALFDADERLPALPVCDHYAGVEPRMRKSLVLQAELGSAFDITLDAEDGAPVGGEAEHALLMAELIASPQNLHGRIGARLPAADHTAFDAVADTLLRRVGDRLAYLMVPKVTGLAQWQHTVGRLDALAAAAGLVRRVPLHALVETHGALRDVHALAAHPRIESLSFGLMDFVSAHRGAVPQTAMSATGQFQHPLVVRAKLEIAAACHGHGKTPSHCVVTEFKDTAALQGAASLAARQFGYTRMWSIHPNQVRPIIEAFAPTVAEVDLAVEILLDAQAAQWAPISHRGVLHDRASYRYFWHVLERAHRTSLADGAQLPAQVRDAFFAPTGR